MKCHIRPGPGAPSGVWEEKNRPPDRRQECRSTTGVKPREEHMCQEQVSSVPRSEQRPLSEG